MSIFRLTIVVILAAPLLCRGQATLTVIAGTGNPGPIGDGGPAKNAFLDSASALTMDAAGNLYVRERARVRKITPAGIISTVAGSGATGSLGDNGPATSAQLGLGTPFDSLAADAAGNLFLVDGA